jgi:lysophospholipase L1-like esterase
MSTLSIRRVLMAAGASVAVIAGTTATAAAAAAPSSPGTTARPAGAGTYVALGDSFAAGYGLGAPATATRPAYPGCAQTSLDYPHRLATWLHLSLTDVTCAGATTADFSASQDVTGPKPPAQLDAVRALQPDLVTITIGGNDFGFTTIAENCLAASAHGPILLHPTYSSCSAYFASPAGAPANPIASLSAIQAKVQAAIAAVHADAPSAKIVVLDYPALVPDAAHTPAAGCFAADAIAPKVIDGIPLSSTLPFTNTDVPLLASFELQLDQRIGAAARDSDATFVDIYPLSLAHSGCAPESQRWVEPVLPAGGGTNALHPSLTGTAVLAAALVPSVARAAGR